MRRIRRPIALILALFFLLGAVGCTPSGNGTEQSTGSDAFFSETDRGGSDSEFSVSAPTENPTEDPTENADREIEAAKTAFDGFAPNAKHLIVYDLTVGAELYAKSPDATITAASTTKLLTALTALDFADESETFTVGDELNLVAKDASVAGLKKGQTLTILQALDALLIPSGNDAAYLIAVGIGRKLADDPQISAAEALQLFLTKMNEKAVSLGTKASKFTCPDGYPDSEQYTTASDMLTIACAAIQNDTIRASCAKTYVKHTLSDGSTLELTTTNKMLLPSSKFYYEGTIGLKTGYTGKAGQCVIACAEIYGHTVLVAVYNAATSDARWNDARNALDRAAIAIEQATEKQ